MHKGPRGLCKGSPGSIQYLSSGATLCRDRGMFKERQIHAVMTWKSRPRIRVSSCMAKTCKRLGQNSWPCLISGPLARSLSAETERQTQPSLHSASGMTEGGKEVGRGHLGRDVAGGLDMLQLDRSRPCKAVTSHHAEFIPISLGKAVEKVRIRRKNLVLTGQS